MFVALMRLTSNHMISSSNFLEQISFVIFENSEITLVLFGQFDLPNMSLLVYTAVESIYDGSLIQMSKIGLVVELIT